MKKERKRPPSFRAIAWRLISLVLATWLTAMGLLTWAVAKDMYLQLENQVQSFTSVRFSGSVSKDYRELPGSEDVARLHLLGVPYYWLQPDPLLPIVLPQRPSSIGTDDWYYGKWELLYGYDFAQILYDDSGEILAASGSYLYFPYVTAEMWKNRVTDPIGLTYVNLDQLKGGAEISDRWIVSFPGSWDPSADYFLPCLRLTGYFEGTEFHPVKMERGQCDDYYQNGMSYGAAGFCLRDTSFGTVTWETIATGEAPADQELVTIYGWDTRGYHEDTGAPVTVDGVKYDTLLDLLDTFLENGSIYNYEKDSLIESVIIGYGWQADEDGGYYSALAVRCWPLQYAMVRMIWVYLVSFALLALVTFLILDGIRHKLIIPLASIAGGENPVKPYAAWQEPYALQEYYVNSKETIHKSKTQIQQLSTALDYARDAEENRRQLVSNLTHELKTPLSVIHGYAEGLQAGIAGEKREQYLSVILEETEKMDAMVLQMLDLSRLEAGKVRLAADTVNLLAMTESIFEKLQPAMEAKKLTVHYGFCQDFTVIADESRISQVITNLASNAIKYTPAGGEIWITAFTRRGMAHISMDNTSPPLSEEALEKVFTSFYRADPSRTEAGTGLGLAIVKSIVELHRGTCVVRNVTRDGKSAVEFSFTLPVG